MAKARKTKNAIQGYAGGIQSLVEAAVSETGKVFKRYQSKGAYGYAWGPWTDTGMTVPADAPPGSIESGFSTLYRMQGETWKKWRLPA